jgi:hypothetical protein
VVVGLGVEMTQALYAHMNNKKKERKLDNLNGPMRSEETDLLIKNNPQRKI